MDTCEQRVPRPADRAEADTSYSGKQRQHTLKVQVAVDEVTGAVVDVADSVRGPTYDLTLLRAAARAGRRPDGIGTLGDPAHRIQFFYVPKHTSWLNQVELWFSILVRRVIKRGNFASFDALRERILQFIAYFNQTAKPFKWTYKGRPLCR